MPTAFERHRLTWPEKIFGVMTIVGIALFMSAALFMAFAL